MYNSIIIFCLCNVAIAATIPQDKDARITSYEYKTLDRGGYKFSYDTSNEIKRSETGQLVNVGQDSEHIAVTGTFSYVDPEGNSRIFQYTADENGYHVNFQVPLDMRVGDGIEGVVFTSRKLEPHIESLLGPG